MQTITIAIMIASTLALAKRWRSRPRRPTALRLTDKILSRLDLGPAAEKLGWLPTYGYLQQVAISEALAYRTVSVTGDVWVPDHFTLSINPNDVHLVAHLSERFTVEIAAVFTERVQQQGWRMDDRCQFDLVITSESSALRPRVTPLHRKNSPQTSAGTAKQHANIPSTPLPRTNEMPPPQPDLTASSHGLSLNPFSLGTPAFRLGSADDMFLLGRSPDAGGTIDAPSVSWMHARISREANGWSICDLDSSNGTIVNGRKIATATPIETGDLVSLGKHVTFQIADHEVARHLSTPPTNQWSPSFS